MGTDGLRRNLQFVSFCTQGNSAGRANSLRKHRGSVGGGMGNLCFSSFLSWKLWSVFQELPRKSFFMPCWESRVGMLSPSGQGCKRGAETSPMLDLAQRGDPSAATLLAETTRCGLWLCLWTL